MADNKILPWAAGSDPNVMSDTDYAAALAAGGTYANGVESGQASSAQANKTWKQSAAVSSGVAQFLTDNLSVDVTDADTAATFSDRIANAILKLSQISPFNSSFATATGGYKKYAIVSDSSGNFWVSTADSNLTTPGAEGASWQSLFNGYATESWANDTFVGKAEGDQDYSPLQAGVNKTSGEIWLSYANSSGDVEYAFAQPAGDYALQTALTAEVTRAEAAEETLNNDKVNRSGDTMTGPLTSSGWIFGGVNGGMSGTPTAGTYMWTEGIGFGNPYNSGNFRGTWCVSDVFDEGSANTAGVNLTGYDATSKVYQWYFAWNGNITTPKGLVAFQSELPTSGTTTHGSYVTVGNIRTLYFMLENIQSGTTYEFDLPFSGTPHSIVVAPIAGAASGSDPATGAWSASGFVFWNAGNLNGSYSFIATGPA